MPWELEVVKYDGPAPRKRADADDERFLPMGTSEEVQAHLSSVLPNMEWWTEPPLIEVMKASGSDSWKDWDEAMIASASKSKLKGAYETEDLVIEIFGFEQDGPLRYVLMEVRGDGNPIPVLHAICTPMGWSVADMSRDAEFLDLQDTKSPRWGKWLRFLGGALRQDSD